MRCSNVLFIDNFVGNITADSQCNENVHKVMKSLGRERWVIFHKNKIRAYAYTQRTTGLRGIRQMPFNHGSEPFSYSMSDATPCNPLIHPALLVINLKYRAEVLFSAQSWMFSVSSLGICLYSWPQCISAVPARTRYVGINTWTRCGVDSWSETLWSLRWVQSKSALCYSFFILRYLLWLPLKLCRQCCYPSEMHCS